MILTKVRDYLDKGLIISALIQFRCIYPNIVEGLEIITKYRSLESTYLLGNISEQEYTTGRNKLVSAFLNLINTLEENPPEKPIIMKFEIEKQVVNGQVNIADTINIGTKFAETFTSKKEYSPEDTDLLKVVGEVGDEEDKKDVPTAVDEFNEDEEKKESAKERITNFIKTYGTPIFKILGKVALGLLLAKYGLSAKDLSLDSTQKKPEIEDSEIDEKN